MLDTLKQIFKDKTYLLPKDFAKIVVHSKFRKLNKGELFIRAGELNYHSCTVIKGLLRHYVINEHGEEKTIRFVSKGMHSGSPDTLFMDDPSCEYIQALEDTILTVIDFRVVTKMTKDNVRLLRIQNESYRDNIVENVRYIKLLNCYSAEDRFKLFCKEYPKLCKRVKQKYLASYLGVTATSLSRIKARINTLEYEKLS